MSATNTYHAASECEMANAILIASAHYKNIENPDRSVIESLLIAAKSSLERAMSAISEELNQANDGHYIIKPNSMGSTTPTSHDH